jgi:hypothetical protein
MDDGVWVTYTCNISESGTYELSVLYAAESGDGTISFSFNEEDETGEVTLESTGSLETWATQTISSNVTLSQGVQAIRIFVGGTGNVYRLNSFSLSLLQANQAPTVTITAPLATDELVEGDSVTITADASDAEGTVTDVEFYIGDNFLGVDSVAPYSITWNYMPEGTYSITAIATDNDMESATSEEVQVTIEEGSGTEETVSLSPIADSYVYDSNSSTNYGTATYMVTKSSGRYMFLKFDLSEIDGAISNAILEVYSKHTKTETRTAYRVDDDSWTEEGITWSNQPEYTSEIASVYSISTGYVNWTVTDFVAIQNGGDRIVTICVKDPEETSNGVDFYSKENGENEPILSVVKKVENSSSIDLIEEEDEGSVLVYPNPVTDVININTQNKTFSTISVFDSTGRLITQIQIDTNQNEIVLDVNDYDKGVYLLKLEGQDDSEIIKVMKN